MSRLKRLWSRMPRSAKWTAALVILVALYINGNADSPEPTPPPQTEVEQPANPAEDIPPSAPEPAPAQAEEQAEPPEQAAEGPSRPPVMVDEQTPAEAEETAPAAGSVKVNRVVDGDTIEVMLNGIDEKVRMIGVDTPEVYGGAEHYGPEASAFTKSRLTGQMVDLEFDVEERDRYGRLLAYVWVGDEMFNQTLVREGYAQVMTISPNVKYADRFLALQREAREAGRGLWAAEAPGTATCPVKGNINAKGEKIYHVPEGRFYERTQPEECFNTPAEAEAAGYRASMQ